MSALTQALWGLAPIAGAVGCVALFGRDPKADEHDVSDYHEPDEATPQIETLSRADMAGLAAVMGLRFREVSVPLDDEADDSLPPAPPGMNAGSPLYAATLFRSWYPDTPANTAARYLRELRDETLAGAR